MHSMVEPFYDATGEGVLHTTMSAQLFKDLRDHALQLPKFGTDTADDEVKEQLTLSACVLWFCIIINPSTTILD